MSDVTVQKVPQATAPVWVMFDDTKRIFDQLQSKAFGIFQQRGGISGRAMDDWFRAERELFNVPASDLTETEGAYHLVASVPGLEGKDIELTATPHEIVVRGSSECESKREEGATLISERCHNEVFRRYELAAPIDVEKVSAKVAEGVLRVEIPKSSVAVQRVPVTEGPKTTTRKSSTRKSRSKTDESH